MFAPCCFHSFLSLDTSSFTFSYFTQALYTLLCNHTTQYWHYFSCAPPQPPRALRTYPNVSFCSDISLHYNLAPSLINMLVIKPFNLFIYQGYLHFFNLYIIHDPLMMTLKTLMTRRGEICFLDVCISESPTTLRRQPLILFRGIINCIHYSFTFFLPWIQFKRNLPQL